MLARLSFALAKAGYSARGLSRSPLMPSHDAMEDQENHDSHASGDVRHHGNHPRNVARVGPDQADDRADEEQADHRG